MRALLALLLVGLAACYSPRTITPGPDGYTGAQGAAWQHDVPLQASLWVDPFTRMTTFELTRPAHVALFLWQPGSHFSMVYPAIGYGSNQHFHAGVNTLFPRARTAMQRGHTRSMAHPASLFQTPAPVYYVLMASEEPLQVGSFLGQAPWVSHVAWSSNLYTATELLASQIVPAPSSTEWTVAYHVTWLEGRDRALRTQWVVCPDGTVIAAPVMAIHAGLVHCPDGTRAEPSAPDTTEAPAERRIAERLAEIRERGLAMGPDRPDEEELRERIRGIKELRGQRPDEVEVPVPTWRRTDAVETVDRPGAFAERLPVPRVARPGSERVGTPAVTGAPGADSPRPAAHRPRADRSPPRAERPADRPRAPAAQRPSAQRPPPPVQRTPPPRTERRSPPPSRDRRPPPDDTA